MKKLFPFLKFLPALAILFACGCQDPDGNLITASSSVTQAYAVWPSHVSHDSIIDSSSTHKIFRLVQQDPFGMRNRCGSQGVVARYIALEFDQPIAGGTTFNIEIPALNYAHEHQLSQECNEHHAFWFQLPDEYIAGQEVHFYTHSSNLTVQHSRADGLVVIANIDAEDPMPTDLAVPSAEIEEEVKGFYEAHPTATLGGVKPTKTDTKQPETVRQPASK